MTGRHSIFSTVQLDYGVLLVLHALTQVAHSYALLSCSCVRKKIMGDLVIKKGPFLMEVCVHVMTLGTTDGTACQPSPHLFSHDDIIPFPAHESAAREQLHQRQLAKHNFQNFTGKPVQGGLLGLNLKDETLWKEKQK